MPVIDHIKLDFTEIVTWHVSETEDELLEFINLTPYRIDKIRQMPEKQRMEYLGLRACLMTLNADFDVNYDDKGKPWIDAPGQLSITHSYGLVAVALSNFDIGIDIEKRRDEKILNIAHKFTREDELSWIPKNENYPDFLHIVWGIKEGLYKLNGGNLWNFRHHYRVEPFDLKENKMIKCWISDNLSSRQYYAYYKMIKGYFLVWVLDYDDNIEYGKMSMRR